MGINAEYMGPIPKTSLPNGAVVILDTTIMPPFVVLQCNEEASVLANGEFFPIQASLWELEVRQMRYRCEMNGSTFQRRECCLTHDLGSLDFRDFSLLDF